MNVRSLLPPTFVALVRLFRRDGFAFFGKCVRYAFSRSAWKWLAGRTASAKETPPGVAESDSGCIRKSVWFDQAWYCRTYPESAVRGVDPAEHYLRNGRSPLYRPGPDFVGDEYLAVNPDVGHANVHPLLHWERRGRREGRLISFLENDAKNVFPPDAVSGRLDFGINPPVHRRTAVFAAYSPDGTVSDAQLLYLAGLREIADNIVFVCSAPLFPSEVRRLDGLVSIAQFGEHAEYDFGSYKRGWIAAGASGLLSEDAASEVVFANDSCYGPVFPFSGTFAEMERRKADFWGLSSCRVLGRDHIQSFFFVFRRKVLAGGELDSFLRSVTVQPSRGYVVMRYEFELTKRLEDAGHSFDTLVPRAFQKTIGAVPSRMPVTTMERYRFPLLKVKAAKGDSLESVDRAVEIVQASNPALAALVRRGTMERPHPRISVGEHRASFAAKAARIAARAAAGEKPVVLFPVTEASFPARPLFDAMCADGRFDARIAVVPDLRDRGRNTEAVRLACRDELGKSVPADRFADAEADEFGLYADLPALADIVCYPSVRDYSCFRFNPHYAIGRPFLPVCFAGEPDGFANFAVPPPDIACFWKTFAFPFDGKAALVSILCSLGMDGLPDARAAGLCGEVARSVGTMLESAP